METINVTKEVKIEFEQERLRARVDASFDAEYISQNEFVVKLLEHWRKKE